MLGACAAAQHPDAPTLPDGATIAKKSHDVLDAFDRADVPAVTAALDLNYIHFENRAIDRRHEIEELKARPPGPPQVAKRTWSDEKVYARGTDAIFIGRAHEQQGGNDKHGGGYTFDGWYTLGWSRSGNDWKLVYFTWAAVGAMGQTAIWNQIYKNGTGFEHAPNHLLVTSVQGLTPGTALDVASGQGRNSLYLATQGWKVTGIDIADEGLRQAREAAAKANLSVEMINADVGAYDYGTDRYDLVLMSYAWPAIKRIPDLQKATKKGGLFVYEFFAPTSPDDEGPQPGALAKQFAGWDILVDTIVEDTPDFATDSAKIQRFVARRR